MADKSSKCVISLEAVQKLANEADSIAMTTYGLNVDQLNKLLEAVGDADAGNALLNKSVWAKAEGVLYEVSVNMMVSGLGTSAVNVMSNTAVQGHQYLKSAVRLGSAALTSGPTSTRAKTEAMIISRQFDQFVRSNKDLISLVNPGSKQTSWAALTDLPLDLFNHPDFVVGTKSKLGLREQLSATPERVAARESMLETEFSRERMLSSDQMNLDPKKFAGKTVDVIGGTVNIFGEILRHQDLTYKMMNYRHKISELAGNEAERLARIEAQELGIPVNQADIEGKFEVLYNYPPDKLVIEAAEHANQTTFTDKLGVAAGHARGALQLPGLRLFTPFFKVLINIEKYNLRESPLNEVTKALHIYKGEDYWTKLAEQSPRGDAARVQAVQAALVTYAAFNYFQDDVLETGTGFTGRLDMRNPNQRQQAEDIAPAFSWRGKDGFTMEFAEIPAIAGWIGLNTIAKKLMAMDAIERYDEEGNLIDLPEQAWTILSNVPEQMFGDFFAMDSLTKIQDLFGALTQGDYDKAIRLRDDIASSALTPGVLKDVNAAGYMIEEALNRTESQRFFSNEMRTANGFMEKLASKWFGKDSGIPYNAWGERKRAKGGLTLSAQSSLVPARGEMNPTQARFAQLDVQFKDMPKQITIPNQGRVRLSSLQRQEYMQLRAGGYIEELDFELPSFESVVESIMFNPALVGRPEHVIAEQTQKYVSLYESGLAGLVALRNEDLRETLETQKDTKMKLDTGQLERSVPLDAAFVKSLFSALLEPIQ